MTLYDRHTDYDAPPSAWDRWLDRVEAAYGARILGTPTGAEDLDWAYGCYLRNASPGDVVEALRARPRPIADWGRYWRLLLSAGAVVALFGAVGAVLWFLA